MPDQTPSIKFVRGETFHGRHGAISNRFKYQMDCVLLPFKRHAGAQSSLFRYNRFGLFSFYDKDHGDGEDLNSFIKKIVEEQRFTGICDSEIWLLTQPRLLGYIFNPVSFWFFLDKNKTLRAVMAEVNNTFGGRHFYICRHNDFRPIKTADKINVKKMFHVSPFQDVAGQYKFKFQFDDQRIGAWIDHKNGDEGVYATYSGSTEKLSTTNLLKSAFFRPFGALRVISLIHWQALKLKLKGGKYRQAPPVNKQRVTR